MIFPTKTASYRFCAAGGTGVGRDSLLVVWVLARVLVLVRDVVVALLRMEERSEAEVDAREVRDERGVKCIDGGRCDIEGGGGGARRDLVAVDDDEEEIDRIIAFGEVGTE